MKIRMWRLSVAEPYGLHLWFDPECEVPTLRHLTAGEKSTILDMPISVSAPTETEATRVFKCNKQLDLLELPF